MQSPIALEVKTANVAALGPCTFENLFKNNICTLENDSNNVRLTVGHDSYVSDGPLRAKYKFDHVHFVWGANDEDGAEHTIDGKRHSFEAQFVFNYSYKFKIPLDILVANKKLVDLKYKIDHPDEEPEEDTDDEDEEEDEDEDLTEEEMAERYEMELKKFERLVKQKMDEWDNTRIEMMQKEKEETMCVRQMDKKELKKMNKENKNKEEFDSIWIEIWRNVRKNAEINSKITLPEDVWFELEKKYAESTEGKEILKQKIKEKQLAERKLSISIEERNVSKAIKLETEMMTRLELIEIEKAKGKYIDWIKREDKLDKMLKKEMRIQFEEYLEILEEREELDDDDEMPENEKNNMRIRWTIQDMKKDERYREKLLGVINRRKKELDEICTKEILTQAVIGLLFKLDNNGKPFNLFSYLTQISEPWKRIEVDGNLLQQFCVALTTGDYFTYSGSLTISPFSENVTWIVMKNPLPILPYQMRMFRQIKDERGIMYSTSRHTQSSGGRPVFFNEYRKEIKEAAMTFKG